MYLINLEFCRFRHLQVRITISHGQYEVIKVHVVGAKCKYFFSFKRANNAVYVATLSVHTTLFIKTMVFPLFFLATNLIRGRRRSGTVGY